jgi:hypothetical protein
MAGDLRLYAATHDGVFVLRSRGGRCEIVGDAIRGQIIDCVEPRPRTRGSVFAGDPRAVFAALGEVARGYAFGTAGDGAILQSDDEGDHWRPVASGLPALRQLAVMPD